MKKLTFASFTQRSLAIAFINLSINKEDLFTICEDGMVIVVYYWVNEND